MSAAPDSSESPAGLDAPRRTHLANERTYLAWWRSGLSAIAVGFAAGKFGPLAGKEEAHWPYAVFGGGFIVLGIAVVLHARERRVRSRAAIDRGEAVPEDAEWVLGFTVVTVILAIGLLALVFVGL